MRRVALILLVAACSPGAGSSPLTPDPDASTPPVSGPFTLVDYSWTLAAHTETYRCVRVTIHQDLYIRRFEPLSPLGTHHSVLSLGDGQRPDGATECISAVLAPEIIYGSGVGTPPMDLPDGVAVKVAAGQQLLLNLHLYNVSEAPLSGTSGVRVELVAPESVAQHADAVLAGTLALTIPPGISTSSGSCTANGDVTLFAMAPHMHRLGLHQKVTSTATGHVLLDRDYTFDTQTFDTVAENLHAGDRLLIDCTYANDTRDTIGWGESTDAEMCFTIIYLYPGGRVPALCLN